MENSSTDAFWSGYVAAMAGLVQSLMLLTVILACAIYLMAVLAGERVEQEVAISIAEQKFEPLSNRLSQKAGFEIHYPTDVWEMDPASKKQVIAEVMRSTSSHPKWELWVGTDTESAIERRSAFLRLISLRSELITLGVQAFQIQTRIIHQQDGDSRVVHLVPANIQSDTQ